MDSHAAPNTECPHCTPPGNRLMSHIRTHRRAATTAGDETLRVLVYQCIQCRRLRSHAHDATTAPRRAFRPLARQHAI